MPVNHRTGDSECTTPEPPGTCNVGGDAGGPQGPCSSDSDCTAGKNGRCADQTPAGVCTCSYDSCSHDTDCAAGSTCACHGTADALTYGNSCAPGNCRVDADCGANGYCSPTLQPMGCGVGVGGYYCHTASDQCIDDTDCLTNQGGDTCAYFTADHRWECTQIFACP